MNNQLSVEQVKEQRQLYLAKEKKEKNARDESNCNYLKNAITNDLIKYGEVNCFMRNGGWDCGVYPHWMKFSKCDIPGHFQAAKFKVLFNNAGDQHDDCSMVIAVPK